MVYDKEIEEMFKDIAKSLKLAYQKTKFIREIVYSLSDNDKFRVDFRTFVNKEGKIVFLTKTGEWGSFKKEELMDIGRKTIIANIIDIQKKSK
ncbi:MAG: hypothetical protein WC755_01340 [Candidatus Woesearchaeota archaeon]